MKPLLSELFLPCSGMHSPIRANRYPLTTITGAQRASGQTHSRARSHQGDADLRADRSTAYLVSCIRVRSAHGNSLDHLVGAGEQRGRHGLFLTLGLIGTIVRPTSIRSSRNRSQFLYFSPDRTEWAEPMLLFGKSVRIGTVWSIDRFLEPNGKIPVKIRLLRAILAHDVACDVIGLLVHQQRGVETGAKWH